MNKKSIKIVLLILILILLFLVVRSTYSKYVTGIESQTTSVHMARWNVKLNDVDIRNGIDFSDKIALQKTSTPHIAENVIVPTSERYFEVKLDSTGTELPYNYKFEFSDPDQTNNLPDYRIVKYQLNSEPEILVTDSDTIITGNVEPQNPDVPVELLFKFYVQWYDESDNILDNRNDVLVSKDSANPNGIIPIKLTVTQLNEMPTP